MQRLLFFLTLTGALVAVSCKDQPDEPIDLRLPQEVVLVPEGGNVSVYIGSGNNEYTIGLDRTDLVHAQVDLTTGAAGSIRITGLEKGSALLTLQDQVNGQQAALRIHVVDPFLVMRAGHVVGDIEGVDQQTITSIRTRMNEMAPIGFGEFLLFQSDARQRFFVFNNETDLREGEVKHSGTYSLLLGYGGPNRLRLDYEGGTEVLEVPIHVPNQQIFSRLLDFSRNLQAAAGMSGSQPQPQPQPETASGGVRDIELKAEVPMPQATSFVDPYYFILYRDVKEYFRSEYPNLVRADLFQQISLYPESHYTWIGESIFMPVGD